MQIIGNKISYKGTVIRLGNSKREFLNLVSNTLMNSGFTEISIPVIQYEELFKNKVGQENNNLMFKFTDRADRKLCLAPEYTAIVQQLTQVDFKFQKDIKLFYIQECFRGERQQRGRWRQFTQLGVEILNPSKDYSNYLQELSISIIENFSNVEAYLDTNVTRGLDYYKDGKGFEIRAKDGLQLCGGGSYDGGIGFAIGVDRILLYNE